MKSSPSTTTLLVILVLFFAAELLFGTIGHARKSFTQDSEKSLDIQMHAKEPLILRHADLEQMSGRLT